MFIMYMYMYLNVATDDLYQKLVWKLIIFLAYITLE